MKMKNKNCGKSLNFAKKIAKMKKKRYIFYKSRCNHSVISQKNLYVITTSDDTYRQLQPNTI